MPSHVESKMGGIFSACYGNAEMPRTQAKVEYIPARRVSPSGRDNPLSDHIVEEEVITILDLPQQELLKLLRAADEAVEDTENILPASMNEIDLGESTPSADDMVVICSVMKRFSQLERISVSKINPRQLERIVPWAEHENLTVTIRNLSITPTEEEFQKLQRIFANHGRYLNSLINDSFLSISLLHIDLTISRYGKNIVPWITDTCQNMDLFALVMPHSYLNDFAITISRSSVKIKRLNLFEQIKFCREELHISGADAICRLIANVTEKIILDFKVEDPFLLDIIQDKLNSLPKTKLEIQFIDQLPGLYRLRWREPMITPRPRVSLPPINRIKPSSSTDQ